MGFWSSLVHTATSAGNWIVNNSGNIMTAAKTIAQVAALVAADDEKHKYTLDENSFADQGGNILPDLIGFVSGAEKTLLRFADKNFPAPPLNVATDGKASDEDLTGSVTRNGPFDVSGIWPNPASSSVGGKLPIKIPPNVTADLNKLLAINNVPTTIASGINAMDVGASISEQVFANSGTKLLFEESSVLSKGFNITTKSGDQSISGGMVYYPVPVGNTGHNAWHAHVRLWYVVKNTTLDELVKERRNLSTMKMVTDPPTGSYNSTTVKTRWTGARNVSSTMTAAVTSFLDATKGKVGLIGPSSNDGTTFKYQFWSVTDIGASDLRASLTGAISQAMGTQTELPRMPEVEVENTMTYVDDTQHKNGAL